MIRTFILFFILTLSSFAANILSYNIYNRTDRVDIMITFDVPYHGKIIKSEANSKIILKLYDVKIESTKIKEIDSAFLSSVSIIPIDNYTQIVADIPNKDIILKVARTTDKYGLRLRFTKKKALEVYNQNHTQTNNNTLANLPTKKANDISTSYYIVVALLIVGIIILLVIKRKVTTSPNKIQQPNSWLFKKLPQQQTQAQTPAKKTLSDSENVSIRFQKQIDEKNSVIMLDFQNQSYLMVLGQNNNLLLDKFVDNKPVTQNEFEALLQEKHIQLDEFLKIEKQQNLHETPSKASPQEDLLKSFSNKASHIPYDL